jgi:hypothetical protein
MAQTNNKIKIKNKEYLLNKDGTPSFTVTFISNYDCVPQFKKINNLYDLVDFNDNLESINKLLNTELLFIISNGAVSQSNLDILYRDVYFANCYPKINKYLIHIKNDLNCYNNFPILSVLDTLTIPETEIVSKLCSLIAKHSYNLKLKTDRWDSLKKQALARAKQRCQICNKSNCKLVPHHRSYTNQGTDLELDDLIILCESCHSMFHDKKIS